jgi:hypothetical protein
VLVLWLWNVERDSAHAFTGSRRRTNTDPAVSFDAGRGLPGVQLSPMAVRVIRAMKVSPLEVFGGSSRSMEAIEFKSRTDPTTMTNGNE